MVGDVKQSIYGFRLADPSLFREKYEAYAEGKSGERIVLAENFRSRDEVLSFTNKVFQQIMNKELGQVEYDDVAALKQEIALIHKMMTNPVKLFLLRMLI